MSLCEYPFVGFRIREEEEAMVDMVHRGYFGADPERRVRAQKPHQIFSGANGRFPHYGLVASLFWQKVTVVTVHGQGQAIF